MSATSSIVARRRSRISQRGAISAEYAMVTTAVGGIGAIIGKIITDPQVQEALMRLLMRIFELVAKNF